MGGVWGPAAPTQGRMPQPDIFQASGALEATVAERDRRTYTMPEGQSDTYTVHLSRKPTADKNGHTSFSIFLVSSGRVTPALRCSSNFSVSACLCPS